MIFKFMVCLRLYNAMNRGQAQSLVPYKSQSAAANLIWEPYDAY